MTSQSGEQSIQAWKPTKIWNIMFISIFFANIAINLGQYMANSILALYADSLGASAGTIGILMSTFAFAAISFRFISAPVMDTYNRKYIVIGAMLTLATAFFGYGVSKSIPSLLAFRLLQGGGMAFGNACCLAMVAEAIPKDKYVTGIGYFSLAQVISQAVGPSTGLWLVSLVGFKITYFIISCVMLFGAYLAFRIKSRFKRTKKLKISINNVVAREALLPGAMQIFQTITFTTINSFLIVFATKQGTENIGLFFTFSAVTALITRPIIGKMTDKYGVVKIFIPGLLFNAAAFIIISISHTIILFLMASILFAIGFGICQPSLQSLCMKSVSNERRGAGSTTNYLGMDVGSMTGAMVAGGIAQGLGYVSMWRIMVIPLTIDLVLALLFRKKIARIEEDFKRQ